MQNLSEKISQIEEKVLRSIDLLEIAKDYCSAKFDKSKEISAVGTIVDVILDTQLKLAEELDNIA